MQTVILMDTLIINDYAKKAKDYDKDYSVCKRDRNR